MIVTAIRSVGDYLPDLMRTINVARLVNEISLGDKAFYFRYFKGYRPEKIGRGRIRRIVEKEVLGDGEGHELLANLLIVHWNEAHRQLYQQMVNHVQTINEDVEAIERIEDDKAHLIIDDMLKTHRAVDLLLCVRLNEVRFSDEVVTSRLVRGEAAPAPGAAPAPQDEDAPIEAEPGEAQDEGSEEG